jgi:hypothetical protein
MWVLDSTQSNGSDQRRVYVNGVQQPLTINTALTQNEDTPFNVSSWTMYLGVYGINNQNGYDGLMSQAYWIDGQALGPGYFGYTDPLTNTWRPKKFSGVFSTPASALYQSSTTLNWVSGTQESNWALSNLNKTATYSGSNTYADVFTAALNSSTTYAFKLNTTVSDNNGGWFFTDSTGISGTHPNERSGNSLGLRSGTSSLGAYGTYASANSVSDGSSAIAGFGDVDPVTGSSIDMVINMSARKVWVRSSGTSSWIGGGDPSNSSSTASFLLPSGTVYFAFVAYTSATITMDTLTDATGINSFYLPLDGNTPIGQDQSGRGNNWTPVNFGGSNTLEKATGALPILNTDGGGKVARPGVFGSEVGAYYTVTTANGSVYQFDITSGDNPSISFIRGATYKFDYSSHTGHPLLFSSTNPDSSTTAYTDGTSIANNVISTVPHNAPDTLYYYCSNHPTSMNGSIGVTTDETKADLYAWKNVLALPLVGSKDDISNSVNSGTSNKTITANGNAAASSAQSNFYGGSFYFDGTGDYLSIPSSSDFELGTGDFTVECFVNFNDVTSNSGYSGIVNRHSLSGGTGWGLWNQASKFGFWMC